MPRALLIAALLLVPASSQACSCAGPQPVCSVYWQSQVVFRGRVVNQTLVSSAIGTVKNLDGSYSPTQGPGFFRVRFSVLEMFRGESQSKEIDILTNDQSSACGFPFATGAEYLVFSSANAQSNELWTTTCSHTHELQPGVEDADLAWMRGLTTAPKGATIYGSVLLVPSSTGPRAAATINLSGPESHSAVPDQTGKYSFDNLPPGQYTVSAALPTGLTSEANRSVSLVEKSCSQIDWQVRYDGHIRGIVSDADGHPLPDMFIVLQRRDPNSATAFADVDLKNTGPDGRYDFAPVSPGDYFVSVNHLGPSPTRPYPRIYYPNAELDSAASVIHLAASATADNIDVVLPNPWKTVTVRARVLLADGSPAVDADVNAYDINYLNSGEPNRADSGADGRVALSVYEGRTYYLVATISGGTQQRCAGPLRFIAKDGIEVGTILINHNWGNCLAQLNPEFRPPRPTPR
jgi:Carboxypeptidase regulatory-like domain/Tissue inhibitor of metalloproteinase